MPKGHYQRRPQSISERFWGKVSFGAPNECWEWRAAVNGKGYGLFGITERKGVKAHRFAFEMTYGPVPAGLFVLHRCDNPTCVNPAHLFLGTLADNNHDRDIKGRFRAQRGEQQTNAKLTECQVVEIRSLYALGGTTHERLAKKFGISETVIAGIVNRRAWKHVADPQATYQKEAKVTS